MNSQSEEKYDEMGQLILTLRSASIPSPTTPMDLTQRPRARVTPSPDICVSPSPGCSQAPVEELRNESQGSSGSGITPASTPLLSSHSSSGNSDTYRILSAQAVFQEMTKVIDGLKSCLPMLNPLTIRDLLIRFNWDSDRVVTAYFEDKAKIFTDSGVIPMLASSGLYDSLLDDYIECRICNHEVQSSAMLSMLCGHNFCKNCWAMYIKTRVETRWDEHILCPGGFGPRQCKLVLEEPGVRKAVTDPGVLEKFYRFKVNSFVECNPRMRWCAMPGSTSTCPNVIYLLTSQRSEVVCPCGNSSCGECGYPSHEPFRCVNLVLWQEALGKVPDQISSINLVPTTVVACPNITCGILNEIGFGNLIKCEACGLKYSGVWMFDVDAWRVQTDWSKYPISLGWSSGIGSSTNKGIFYFRRYMDHVHAARREEHLKVLANRKSQELVDTGHFKKSKAEAIIKIVKVLAKLRRLVMNTYGFVYIHKGGMEMDALVRRQGRVEASVEILSRDIVAFLSIKSKVKETLENLKTYCAQCEVSGEDFMKFVENGYERNIWKCTY